MILLHCTAHLQVRWLCRVKSMKHEPYPRSFSHTWHIPNVLNAAPADDDFIVPDTFACRKELYDHIDTVASRLWIERISLLLRLKIYGYFNSRFTPAQRSCSRQTVTMRFLNSDSNLNFHIFTATLGPLLNGAQRRLGETLFVPFAQSGSQFARLESDRSHISSYKTCTVEISYPYPPYFISPRFPLLFFSSLTLKAPHTTLLTPL